MSETREGGQWRGPATLDVETMVWDLPIKVFPTNPLHASSVTLLKTGSSIQVWCRCGVEPPPLSPNTHIMSDLFTDWLLHPSLMSLRCGTSPPTSCQTSSQRLAPPSKSDVAVVWNLPPSPPTHTHIMSDLFTDWLLHPSLMSLWCGTSPPLPQHTHTSCQTSSQTGSSIQVWCRCGVEPLPPHHVKPLHRDWLLHPSLMLLWCGTSPPLPNTHTHHVRPLHRLAPPSKSDVAVVWNLPPSPQHTHTSCRTSSQTGSSIQVWCRCGVEPLPPHHVKPLHRDWLLHPGLMLLWCGTSPPPPNTHIMSDLFTDWLLHPSLMSLRCGTSPPLPQHTHTSCQTSSQTGSSIQVWCCCGVEPLPPLPQHTHTSCQTSSQTGSSIQVWCRCGVEPPPLSPNTHTHHVRPLHRLAPPSKSDVAAVWNLPPPQHTHHVRPLHRLAPPSKSDVSVVWNLSPHIMSNLFTETGSSIQVWCCCGVEPPPSPPKHTHIMSDLFTDWLLHPSLMSLWNGTSPHPLHHVRPLHRMASQVWCHCGVEPLPTHYVKPLHKLAPPFKADVTMCGISQQPPSQFIDRCLEDWLLHPSFMSKWCGTHLSPPTPPPSPPNTRMPFMLCHLAKDWYLHSSVMSPWWTSFTLHQWLYWRLAPPFQADDADFCGS